MLLLLRVATRLFVAMAGYCKKGDRCPLLHHQRQPDRPSPPAQPAASQRLGAQNQDALDADKAAFIHSVVAFLKASKAVGPANPIPMASIGQSCPRPRHLPQLKVLVSERPDLFGVAAEGLVHRMWLRQPPPAHGQPLEPSSDCSSNTQLSRWL